MKSASVGPGALIRDGMEFGMLCGLAGLVRAGPRNASLWVGAAVGQVAWMLRMRRRLVLENLAITFPDWSEKERARVGAVAARNFGRTAIEFLRLTGRDRGQVIHMVEIEGLDELRAAVEGPRGVVVVTAHLGAFALYVGALVANGLETALLVGRQRNPLVDRLIFRIPQDAVQFISKSRHAPKRILEAMRARKVIVITADHYSSDQRLKVPFLGRDAFTVPIPSALAARHGTPMFLMHGRRLGPYRHRVRILPIEAPGAIDGTSIELAWAKRINDAIGEAILADPEQYFWYHDRWKVRFRRNPPPVRRSKRPPRVDAPGSACYLPIGSSDERGRTGFDGKAEAGVARRGPPPR